MSFVKNTFALLVLLCDNCAGVIKVAHSSDKVEYLSAKESTTVKCSNVTCHMEFMGHLPSSTQPLCVSIWKYLDEVVDMDFGHYLEADDVDFEDVEMLTDPFALRHGPVFLTTQQVHSNTNRGYIPQLENVIFLFVQESLLETGPEWFQQLNHEADLDRTCCLDRRWCDQTCVLPELPFLSAMKQFNVPVLRKGVQLVQNVFTYVFLAQVEDTAENIQIVDISHELISDNVNSIVTVTRASSLADEIFLLTHGQKARPKRIRIIDHCAINFNPFWYDTAVWKGAILGIGMIHRQTSWNKIRKAYYTCSKPWVHKPWVYREAHNDHITVELRRSDYHGRVDFEIAVAYVDESIFGTFECWLKLEATPSRGSTSRGRSEHVLHLATINVYPKPWEEQAKYLLEHFLRNEYSAPAISRNAESFRQIFIDSLKKLFFFKTSFETMRTRFETVTFIVITCVILLFGYYTVKCSYKYISAKMHRDTIDTVKQLRGCATDKPLLYKYDLFLSYSSVDRAWVEDELLYTLEKEGFSVCYDQRHEDFPGGQPIIKSIENAIRRSRKTLVVFSPDYLSSDWAKFELIMVYTGILEGDLPTDSLVVVKYRPCKIPYGLSSRTYNDWTNPQFSGTWLETVYSCLPYFVAKGFRVTLEDEERKRRFWDRLVDNVGRPSMATAGGSV